MTVRRVMGTPCGQMLNRVDVTANIAAGATLTDAQKKAVLDAYAKASATQAPQPLGECPANCGGVARGTC